MGLVDDIVKEIGRNPKALVYSLGIAVAWAIYVRIWKKRLERNMGFLEGSQTKTTYDYVIVGGGTAGCLLAARLSEDPSVQVLLLEAGRSAIGEIGVCCPALSGSIWDTDHEWAFETVPQEALNERSLRYHRARLLGGNGTNDNLLFGNGIYNDFQNWVQKYGLNGWGYNDLVNYFQNNIIVDKNSKKPQEDELSGKISIENSVTTDIGNAFILACEENDFPQNKENSNKSKSNQGVSVAKCITKDHLRTESASAFLLPIFQTRKNLTIRAHAYVTQILMEENRAVGAQFESPYGSSRVEASKEVILCGGAINNPVLLMLSGIGPKDHLDEHCIECIKDLPVGENLQDQLAVTLSFQTKHSSQSTDNALMSVKSFIKGLLDYYFFSSGLFYTSTIEAIANECNENEDSPDIQYLVSSRNLNECYVNLNETAQDYAPKPGVSFQAIALHPKSKGSIKLKANDPFALPIIEPNYCSEEDDKLTLVNAVKKIYNMTKSNSFEHILDKQILEKEEQDEEKSDEFWMNYVSNHVQSANHHIGTCRMGTDPSNSVVDKELKVHGIENLRIIDGSVIPEHVSSCNPRAVTMAIAEKGAILIKETHQ